MSKRNFRNVAEALLWLTDCHIATYAYQASLKKTSQSELRRLREICMEAECICREFGVEPEKVGQLHERRVGAKRIQLEVHGVPTDVDKEPEEKSDVRGAATKSPG